MSFLTKAMAQAAAGAGGVETDEYFNQTTLLLHGDGSQGANNVSNPGPPAYVAFEDGSDNDFPITVNGDAYGSPFSPYNTSWSNYFDGTGDYLTVADNAVLQMGSGDFTVEFWWYPTIIAGYQTPIDKGYSNTGALLFQTGIGDGKIIIYASGSPVITSSTAVTVNAFNHFALCRSGTSLVLYLNGVSVGTATNSTNFNNSSTVGIGATGSASVAGAAGSLPITGYLSNIRFVKGRAVYTSAFTPPTAPLTATSGGDDPPQGTETSLLICQSNRFVDNSSNAFAITANGNVAVKSLSPFAETDTTTGSGYFDGSGDYLTSPNDAAMQLNNSTAFTLECWFYPNAFANQNIFRRVSGSSPFPGYALATGEGGAATNTLVFYDGGGWRTVKTGLVAKQWYHFAATYEGSGTTLRFFVNGVQEGSALTCPAGISNTSDTFAIGAANAGTNPFTGFVSGLRVVKNSAVWTSAFTPPTSPATSDANTSLLTCQYRGTVRNVGFIDSSPNKFLITRFGNTTQGTFSPFSYGWSNYFDGASDYLTTPVSANLALGGSDFCIEWWEYRTSIADFEAVMGGNTSYVSAYDPIIAWTSGSDVICYLSGNGSSFSILNAFDIGTATANQWIHRALTRDGNTFRGFENGVLINTTTASGSVYMSANSWRIGQAQAQGANTFPGFISNLRMVIGSPVYTAGFTPSTSPLTTTSQNVTSSEVELLTCQSNRFVDNSSNGFAITPAGNVAVQPFSPFAPSAAYDVTVNGGSGYFDGTGDYLAVADDDALDVEASDFTLEFFYYPLAVQAAGNCLFSKRATTGTFGAFLVYFAGANLTPSLLATTNGSTWGISTASSQSFVLNQWNHCAVTRSGNTWKMFVNAVAGITATLSGTVPNNAAALAIGAAAANGTSVTSACYMSGFRLLKGTAIDFASTGIPTAPPTPITNTSLLCNFTNAGILDNTGKNNLETVGNAQVDTSVVKYGTGSMKFDGSGDRLSSMPSQNSVFGTGDFTIECWLYVASNPAQFTCIASNWAGANPCWILSFSNGSGNIRFNDNGAAYLTSSSAITTGQFVHIAVSRSGTSLKMFFDGVEVASATNSTSFGNASTGIHLGAYYDNSYPLNGLIDDFRITKGVARYTSNFTVPDKAFPDQ